MTEVQARELGRLIKRTRLERGLSLRALDELTGASYGWIRRLERGQMTAPAPSKLTKIAEALSIAPERIDRLTRGRISRDLPTIRTYFRAKYKLTPHEITQIEEVFDQIRRGRREHQGGELHD
jgi:transcriptional regulator with XRE-family HTH domain